MVGQDVGHVHEDAGPSLTLEQSHELESCGTAQAQLPGEFVVAPLRVHGVDADQERLFR